MTPVIVIARLKTRADRREAWIAAARTCIEETRKEPGCLSYDMHESVTEPGRFVFVEQWQDRAALERHMTLPHLQTLVAMAAGCVAEAPSIEAMAGGERWRLM
ncbi:MAG: putative quinol monooxygenase [Beijerinckiaceae bacterium]|nr:putative quinol monooxygenase [Beijerinckiaceae bacterium]